MSPDKHDTGEAPVLNRGVASRLDEVADSGLLDYRSEALPTWCPGCGYYGITHALAGALVELGIENENLVVVSGIGCAGRYPFFLKGYGFHGVHGRALPLAGGVKIARPELTVLVVGGDGDGLGIGGGHLPHAIRRNIDVTYILFDNGIYGLTKGQSSPTTPQGQRTGTHPWGNPDTPLDPVVLGLGYRASFLATGFAGDPDQLAGIFTRALAHRGFSFVPIVTPCVTFDAVNITWDRMREGWQPVPEDHDPNDLSAALALALDENRYYGVLYEETDRPTFADAQAGIADRAGAAVT